MNTHASPHRQSGAMLLEALIAILIFSLGILAIVGLQAASIKSAGDAKYRSDASLLANQLIGQMWVSDRTAATLQSNFSSPSGANYTPWLSDVAAELPGASATPPTVSFATDSSTATPSSVATITIYWNAPNEPALAHKYITVAQIE
jgi:type IV pilus assembly protein PilV